MLGNPSTRLFRVSRSRRERVRITVHTLYTLFGAVYFVGVSGDT